LRVISKKIVREFWKAHADSEQQWKSPNDVKLEYPNASILVNNRVVFNIKGNNYRLIIRMNYGYQMVWIRFIGTHGEYDKINANEI
jgi:mRNA interferase HigB